MAYIFFYISIAAVLTVFIKCASMKGADLRHFIIGVTSSAYSLVYDIILGDNLKLYFYLDTQHSTLYMALAGVLLYPVLNIIYLLFLPLKFKNILVYTIIWIASMQIFEFITVLVKIIVFTGWKIFPWSPVTYLFTYSWINIFYRYLTKRVPVQEVS